MFNAKEYYNKLYHKRKDAGLCTYCGGEREDGCKTRTCAKCRAKINAYGKRHYLDLKKQAMWRARDEQRKAD